MRTVAEWFADREPAPPPGLLRRLGEALGTDGERDAGDAADVCLAAGERLLMTVLSDDEASRDYALDLLAADALVTYAFEAAAEHPGDLAGRATRAMARIAMLGAAPSAGDATSRVAPPGRP